MGRLRFGSEHHQKSTAMPSQTFFNLPNKKRQRITELALVEFAVHDYDSASITTLVKQAKIAKGSFYQYFKDKKDLYLYLVDLAAQQKLAFFRETESSQPKGSFFLRLRWLFDVSTQFDLSHPALTQIINRAVYGDIPFREEVMQRTQAATSGYLRELVQQGIERGDIAPGLNLDLAVFAVQALGNELRQFIPRQLALNVEELAQEIPPSLDMATLHRLYDDVIQILERGIGNFDSERAPQTNPSQDT